MEFDAVVFDIGNVVLDFDFSTMLGKTARISKRTTKEITRWFGMTELEMQFETGRIEPRPFFEEIRDALSLPMSFEEFTVLWNHIFSQTPGVSKILRGLAGKKKLLAATNTNRLHLEYIRNTFPILDLFDSIVASCEIGHRKPDPALYREIVERAEIPPENIVFVDDLERNVQGAVRAGMMGILFQGAEDLRRRLTALGVLVL